MKANGKTKITKNHVSGGGNLLQERHSVAIDALLSGSTTIDAALAAGVQRETVSRWRHANPFFIAELNRRRFEIRESTKAGIAAMISDAEAALRASLQNPETSPNAVLQSMCGLLPKLYAAVGEWECGRIDADAVAEGMIEAPSLKDILPGYDLDREAVSNFLEQSARDLDERTT
jgi:hypothetical protein